MLAYYDRKAVDALIAGKCVKCVNFICIIFIHVIQNMNKYYNGVLIMLK